MADRQLKVTIVGDTKNLDRALGRTQTRLEKFGRAVGGTRGGKVGAAFSGGGALAGIGKAGFIGAGVAAGSAVAVKSLSAVIEKAKEAEVAQANLAQAFESAGIASATYGDSVDKTIQSVSRMSGIDDELVTSAFASLLRTTGSVEKATKDVGLAANIARARNISLAAAAKVVEKAENGQLRGLRALGVQIDSNTTSVEAIDRANQKFAGSAVRYGRTAQGAQDKLNVAFENLQERIGAKLLPVVTKLALKLVDFLDWSEKNWPKFAKSVEDAYKKSKPFIDAVIKYVKAIANEIAGMVKIVHGLFTGDWSEAWSGFKQVAIDGVLGVVKAVASLPIKIARSVGSKIFDGIERAFEATMNRIIRIINRAIRVYNKIPLVPNIDTVPTLGGNAATKPRAAPAAPQSAPRGAPPVRGERYSTSVNLVVDGAVLARTLIPQMARAGKRTAGTTSGRNPNPMQR